MSLIYTELTKKAMNLSFHAHSGQVDSGGTPYIFHVMAVAEKMKDELSVSVALLHDVLEDTPVTEKNLLDFGFPQELVDCVKILTRKNNEDYFHYIDRIKMNPIAVKIKLADLENNSELARLEKITEKDLKRAEKYKKAIMILQSED